MLIIEEKKYLRLVNVYFWIISLNQQCKDKGCQIDWFFHQLAPFNEIQGRNKHPNLLRDLIIGVKHIKLAYWSALMRDLQSNLSRRIGQVVCELSKLSVGQLEMCDTHLPIVGVEFFLLQLL